MSTAIAMKLDAKGLACPLPIVETARAMQGLAPGERIEVEATDPGSVADFDAWARSTGNRLIEQTEDEGVYRFVLERKG